MACKNEGKVTLTLVQDDVRNGHWLSIMFTSQNATLKDMYRGASNQQPCSIAETLGRIQVVQKHHWATHLKCQFAFGKPIGVRFCRFSEASPASASSAWCPCLSLVSWMTLL